jgi:eukaryotic-like serine/threonine-protein kinase
MGSVWMADQLEPVRRRVAVKLIHPDRGPSQALLARFEAERQAIALMDHPHIAKLLDAGTTGPAEAPTLGADRPYFVMELIKGVPLTDYCDQHRLSIPERLRLFTQVCSAVQHAHQKGIIHRDLKPSNILVEAHDDRPVPRVIDFGLAKALGGQSLTEHSLLTGFGTVAGTPLYMAPEQAQFNATDVDTRADVYALGVILYELLTGTTPIEREQLKAAALDEVLRVIRESEPPPPSKRLSSTASRPGVAANRQMEPLKLGRLLRGDLDWIVMKALAKERDRRYETATGLARDIERFLNHEPVLAGPPSAGYRLKKFVRRHPLELALAGALALLLVGGVAVAWWQNEQAGARRETDLRRRLEDEQRSAAEKARLGRNAEAVAGLLGQCEAALRAGDAAKAQVALDAAKKRSAEGGAEGLVGRLGRLAADLALSRDLDGIDQFRWTWAGNKFPDPAVVAARTRQALRRFGADPDAGSVEDAAARVSASAVRDRIVTALDRLLREEKTAGVRAVLRVLDTNPFRDAVRDAVLADDRAKLVELAGEDQAQEQPAGFVAFLGDSKAIAVERRRQLLEAAVSRQPKDLGLLMTLAWTYPVNQEDGANERLRWLQAAVAAAPGNAAALIDLAIALRDTGQLAKALTYCQKAVEIDRKYAMAHNNLGAVFADMGKMDEAIASFHRAIALDPKNAEAHSNLILALSRKGQVDQTIAWFHKAIALDPKSAKAHTGLGNALYRKGQVDKAIDWHKKAIALDPKLAVAHSNLGGILCDAKKEYDRAIACFRKAIALDPKSAYLHANLGNALLGNDEVDEAIASFRKAIDLDPKDAFAHNGLGCALVNQKKLDEAIACFRKATELDPKNALRHYSLGLALSDNGQVDEAIASFRKAIALEPKLAVAHNNLGGLLCDRKRDYDGAIACFRKLVELEPFASAHANLGNALLGKGQLDEAIACYQKAIKLDPKLAYAHGGLAQALLDKGRYAAARAAASRALELYADNDPNRSETSRDLQTCERLAKLEGRLPRLLEGKEKPASARESLDVAMMCQHKRMYAAAARFSADAYAADPRLGDDLEVGRRYHAARSAAQAAAGQGEDAAGLTDEERARLRKQALAWLRADLALRTRQLESGKPDDRAEVQKMGYWQWDSDLSSIRDKAALAKLPSQEQKAFAQLWAEVAALLTKLKREPGKEVREPPTQPKVEKKVEEKGQGEAEKLKRATEHLRAGKRELALPLLVEVWKGKKARLGPDHPDTLDSMNQLGVVYWELGQLDKSVPLFEELLKIREAKLGRGHPDTLQSVANLGVNYKDAGRLKEAIALLEEARRAAQKNPELAWVSASLIDAYTRAGENARIAALLGAELPAIRKALPPDSPQLAGLLAQGGMALLNLKKWAEAEPLLRECLAIREKQQPDAWMTFNTQSMLGGVLLGQKKYADAEPLLRAGYAGMKKREGTIPPQGRPRLVEAAERLVQLYEALGRKDEVARWAKELEAIKAAEKKAEKKP